MNAERAGKFNPSKTPKTALHINKDTIECCAANGVKSVPIETK